MPKFTVGPVIGGVLVISMIAVAHARSELHAVTPPGIQEADPWQPIRFFLGTWQGTSEGEPGRGTVERSYAFVLKGRFIQERNVSTYPPRGAGASGEVHEHLSYFSYDRARRALVLRQFHQEGFVNQFVLAKDGSVQRLVFDSERLENLGTWRARETYEVISNDEFIEIFEIGAPGQPLHVYSRNHFKRVR